MKPTARNPVPTDPLVLEEAAGEGAPFTEQQIDELLEAFERGWSGEASYLERIVRAQHVTRCPIALSEVVRADIDRRYSASLDVDLRRYFAAYPQLLGDHQAAAAVAFEDFRARRSRGLDAPRDRWGWIPGVVEADWYRRLSATSQREAFHAGTFDSRDSLLAEQPALAGQPAGEPQVGRAFGDFQLLALLGTGAFSRVFLATQQSLASRYVAVKVVRRSLAEPVHLARLQHTGIVPLYSFHRIGQYSVLCMPYYGSATMADWLDLAGSDSVRTGKTMVETVEEAQRRLTQRSRQAPHGGAEESPEGAAEDTSLAQSAALSAVRRWHATGTRPLQRLETFDARSLTLWLAQRLTSALAHAHDRGIVHGDLKPANILLRNDGEPALIDFNLAKEADGAPQLWVGGTLPYMSPEQLRSLLGRQSLISPASDVYSLGVIFYELVEGRLPFPVPASAAEDDIASALQQRSAARISWTRDACTEGMRAIIAKCLSINERDRYASAGQLLEDVERERANLPLTHGREPLLTGRWRKFVRRHPRIFSAAPIAVVSLTVMLILGAVGYRWRERSLALSAAASIQQFERESRPMLTHLVDAEPAQVRAAVHAFPQRLSVFLETAPGQLGASPVFERLDERRRFTARRAVFDSCLVASSLALERARSWNEDDRRAVAALLQCCRQFPDLAAESPHLALLEEKLAWHAAGRVPEEAGSREEPPPRHAQRPLEEVLRSRGLLAIGQPRRALQRLHATQAVPEPAVLFWLTVGQAQMELGQYDAAVLSFSLAVEDAPRSAAPYARRAAAYQALRDWSGAERDSTQAIQLEPRRAVHWANRALARERKEDFRGACGDLDAALEREPGSNRLLLMRSRMLRRLGKEAAARGDFVEAMRIRPDSVADWISRALAQLPRYPQRALADLKQAERLDPYSVDVQQNLAHVQAEHLRDNDAALQSLDRILQLQPRHEMARGGRCVLLARERRTAEALADVQYLLAEIDKPQPATLYQIACAHALLSERRKESREEALRYLARAVRLGYGTNLLDSDPDLEPLRKGEEFETLKELVRLSRD